MKKTIEDILCHHGEDAAAYYGAVVPPISQNSLFTFKNLDAIDEAFSDPLNANIYTRGNNPTCQIAEQKLAALCNAEKARIFASGMAAISSSIMHFARVNGHIIAIKNVYSPAHKFMSQYLKEKMNIEVTFVSGEDSSEFEAAIKDNTCLIYLESPSSAVMSLQNIAEITKIAKAHNIGTVLDNTWATPLFQKTLDMGVDLEVHSCSKYLGGHSDLVLGVVAGAAKHLDAIASDEYPLFGGKVAPIEAWLLIRSLRTLKLRVEAHQKTALAIAQFLESHPKVTQVNYPGLKSHPQYELALKQMSGFTGLMSFVIDTDDINVVKKFVDSLKHFSIGVSWGGHESLAYAPIVSYIKEMSPEMFAKTGIDVGLIRISVGLENEDELIEDMENSFNIAF